MGTRWKKRRPWLSSLLLALLAQLGQAKLLACSDGQTWTCAAKRVQHLSDPSFLTNPNQFDYRASQRAISNFYAVYLNKLDSVDGSFYVSARVKVEIKQWALSNATGIALAFLPLNGREADVVFYEARLKARREIPPNYTVDFVFNVERQLFHSHQYQLEFRLFPVDLGLSARTWLNISNYEVAPTDCSGEDIEREGRQREASRWTSAIKELVFFPNSNSANLTFFGAPASYCIDAYEVQLLMGGLLPVERHLVRQQDMKLVDGVVVGGVTLTKIWHQQNYTARIIPFNSRNKCVCKNAANCACVTVYTELFSFPTVRHNSEGLSDASVKAIAIRDKTDQETSTLTVVALCCAVGATGVMFLVLACQTRNAVVLIPDKAKDQSQQPLMRKLHGTSSSVLLLNVEARRNPQVDWLAKLWSKAGTRVIHPQREMNEVEKNVQLWCQKVVRMADKIVLFHSLRMSKLISNEIPASDMFDLVFFSIMALVHYNDRRIVHVGWDGDGPTTMPTIEVKFLLPRDLANMCGVVSPVPVNKERVSEFAEAYNTESRTEERPLEEQGDEEVGSESAGPLVRPRSRGKQVAEADWDSGVVV